MSEYLVFSMWVLAFIALLTSTFFIYPNQSTTFICFLSTIIGMQLIIAADKIDRKETITIKIKNHLKKEA